MLVLARALIAVTVVLVAFVAVVVAAAVAAVVGGNIPDYGYLLLPLPLLLLLLLLFIHSFKAIGSCQFVSDCLLSQCCCAMHGPSLFQSKPKHVKITAILHLHFLHQIHQDTFPPFAKLTNSLDAVLHCAIHKFDPSTHASSKSDVILFSSS